MTVLKLQQLERTRTDCGLSKGAVMALCVHCGQPFKAKRADAKFCSLACKQAGHRAKSSVTKLAKLSKKAPTYLTPQNRQKPPSQVIEIIDTNVTDKPISKKAPLRFERVNSVTIKVTDGEMIRTPTAGQMAGLQHHKRGRMAHGSRLGFGSAGMGSALQETLPRPLFAQ